ncbi:hypothetical protein [Noviluteimonas gilva]|uniref:Uncharacterized protein n=1 Tax=Noviluteimonas gilva TaxID=2682097 RepID=A0A7C9LLZ5_9GAMM|nr:hypothetical protein [Lysobacter gilvus]MUV13583.1 hypothetical protein [Lysobacter gilvus]
MTREAEIRRAQRAQEVLNNDVFVEAWDMIEAEIYRQWRESRNAGDREQLHQLLGLHGKIKAALEAVMRSGDITKAQLQRDQTRAESQVAYLAGR